VIDVAAQKAIVGEADRLDVKDKAVIVLCELMFKDPLKVQSKIKNNRHFFLRVSCIRFDPQFVNILISISSLSLQMETPRPRST